MTRRKFLYFLIDSAGYSYYVENGVVKRSGTPRPLTVNPDGWNNKVVNYARNTNYLGVFRSFSVQLRFVKDGAHILRQRLFTEGMEDAVALVILKLDPNTGKHAAFYKGEIDFSKFSNKDEFFQANVIEAGLMKWIKAYEGTTYEIDLTDADSVLIKDDGLKLQKNISYNVYNDPTITNTWHTLPCAMTVEEGTSFGILTGDSRIMNNPVVATDEENWLIKNVGNDPLDIEMDGAVYAYDAGGGSGSKPYTLGFSKNDGTFVTIWNADLRPDQTYAFTGLSVTLNAGEKLFLIGRIQNGWSVGYLRGEIKFTVKTKYKTTYIRAKNAAVVAKELIQHMAGSDYSFTNPSVDLSKIFLTSGDAVRGLSGAKLKTTWKDMFAMLRRNCAAGISEQGKNAELKPLSDLYTSTIVADIGEVDDCEFAFAEDLLANKIKVGYPAQSYDDVNGREEFNNTHEYSAPITRVAKEFDLTAQYRADMYGIEFLRINLDGKTTTDNSSDNTVFMIMAELDTVANDGTYKLYRPTYDSISGLIDPVSAFNIELSPKRILFKWGAWLRSIFWPMDGKSLKFQTTEKNPNLSTTVGTTTIKENADVVIGGLPAPLFLPIRAKFKPNLSQNLIDIMSMNPYGLFKFNFKGKQYKGWIEEASQRPSDQQAQDWTVLLSSDNDLNNLIYG